VYGFKYLGTARRAAGKDKRTALFIWALGSALFANVVAFLGIAYFDQTMVAWYALLAMIPAAMVARPKKELKQEPLRVPPQQADISELAEEPASLGVHQLSTQ
jgi:hypothetical protein